MFQRKLPPFYEQLVSLLSTKLSTGNLALDTLQYVAEYSKDKNEPINELVLLGNKNAKYKEDSL